MFCLGGGFVRGFFGKGGFCPGGFCPGVYVRGVFVRGGFVLEPYKREREFPGLIVLLSFCEEMQRFDALIYRDY